MCVHTANAARFFPPIIVVTSNVTQKCQHRISRLFVQGFYALNTLYGTGVKWEFWVTNEISKRRWEKCITNRAEWNSSSVLHCNVTVAAWRREIHATSARLYNVLAGDENHFLPKYFDPDRRPPDFILYFNTLRLDLHSAWKLLKWQCQVYCYRKKCHFSTYEEVAGKSYSLEISFTVCQKYSIMMLD